MGKDLDPKIRQLLSQCSEVVGEFEADTFSQDLFHSCTDETESPIEQCLAVALATVARVNVLKIRIQTQLHLDNFRADFLLTYLPHIGPERQVIVECDSQAFHDRTEPERRHEKRRERHFVRKGFRVLHYTGKEILERPIEVACETISILTENDPSDLLRWVREFNPEMR